MVKVIPGMGPATSAGPEIVSLANLTRPDGVAVPGGTVSPLTAATETINNLDRWITIADKGITLLGRADGILGKVMSLRGSGPGPQQPPQAPQLINGPLPMMPAGMQVNAEKPMEPLPVTVPAVQPPAAVEPAPVRSPLPGGINVLEIADALSMIDKAMPGVTCAQLEDSIRKNPEAVQNIMTVFLAQRNK